MKPKSVAEFLQMMGAKPAVFENNLKGKPTTTKQKITTQADNMLKVLEGFKTASQLNYETKDGKQYWWGTRARLDTSTGKKVRPVKIKYANQVMSTDGIDLSCADDPKAVAALITKIKKGIEDGLMDELITAEEQRRPIAKAERAAAKAKKDAEKAANKAKAEAKAAKS